MQAMNVNSPELGYWHWLIDFLVLASVALEYTERFEFDLGEMMR